MIILHKSISLGSKLHCSQRNFSDYRHAENDLYHKTNSSIKQERMQLQELTKRDAVKKTVSKQKTSVIKCILLHSCHLSIGVYGKRFSPNFKDILMSLFNYKTFTG